MPDYHPKTIFHGHAIVPYNLSHACWMLPGNKTTAFRHVAELWAVEMDKLMNQTAAATVSPQ